jgi:hypothetical protein
MSENHKQRNVTSCHHNFVHQTGLTCAHETDSQEKKIFGNDMQTHTQFEFFVVSNSDEHLQLLIDKSTNDLSPISEPPVFIPNRDSPTC